MYTCTYIHTYVHTYILEHTYIPEQHSEGLLHIWESLESFCQLCPGRWPQLNVLAATEVRSIAVAFPSVRRQGTCSCRVFNLLACHRAVVASFAYTCNVCRHASRRRQSTCIRVHVTCTMALRGVWVCTTPAVNCIPLGFALVNTLI